MVIQNYYYVSDHNLPQLNSGYTIEMKNSKSAMKNGCLNIMRKLRQVVRKNDFVNSSSTFQVDIKKLDNSVQALNRNEINSSVQNIADEIFENYLSKFGSLRKICLFFAEVLTWIGIETQLGKVRKEYSQLKLEASQSPGSGLYFFYT